jgi:Leucine-rich repeat (LRR) protein
MELEHLKLSNNRLEGSVPVISGHSPLLYMDLSGNMLTGSIPPDYAVNASFTQLLLKDNKLTGLLPPSVFMLPHLVTLNLAFNGFTGSIPPLRELHSLAHFSLGNNRLRGNIPAFPQPSALMELDLSHNHFGGPLTLPLLPNLANLDISFNFFKGPLFPLGNMPSLKRLNVGHNGFSGTLSSLPALEHVDLSYNSFNGTLPRGSCSKGTLNTADFSRNRFTGSIPADFLVDLSASPAIGPCPIESLSLAHNNLQGTLHTLELDQILALDISNNSFCFECPEITSLPTLLTLRASNNKIFGSFSLAGMTDMETVDFSSNSLNVSFDFTFIGAKFNSQLQFLSISNNPIPRVKNLNGTDLSRTTSSHSIVEYPLIDCYTLAFKTSRPVLFNYDDELFDFQQCDCTTGHFGQPPDRCLACPAFVACRGPRLTVSPGYYAYLGEATPEDPLPKIYVESCSIALYTGVETSCKGAQLDDGNPASIVTIQQCAYGSTGRMCTRCICDPQDGSDCFFLRGSTCVHCKKTFSVGLAVALIVGALIVAFAVLTFIMWTLLNSRRTVQTKRWDELPLSKRFVYRVIHGVGLGLTPIGITFVQLLSELTHWDSYAIRSWARIMNGEIDGLGADCFFPSLAQPFPLLLIRLLLPVAAALFVIASIAVAEIISRAQSSDAEMGPTEDTIPILDAESPSLNDIASEIDELEYPVSALMTTSTISIIQFFYFGSTLAATEYFFSAVQPGTGKKFVQSRPWMEFQSAATLRNWSIPALILFTLVIPVAFLVVVWRIRGSVGSQKTFIYFGTLFTRYNTRYYWWEIVSVILRLAIALALRGISPTSAMQSATMVGCLLLVLILTTSLQPWRRRIENLMASISTALLLSCLFASHTGNLSSTRIFTMATQILSAIYFLALLIFIFFLAVTSDTDYIRRFQAPLHTQREPNTVVEKELELAAQLSKIIDIAQDSDGQEFFSSAVHPGPFSGKGDFSSDYDL